MSDNNKEGGSSEQPQSSPANDSGADNSGNSLPEAIRPNGPVEVVCHNEVRGNTSIRTFTTDLLSNKK